MTNRKVVQENKKQQMLVFFIRLATFSVLSNNRLISAQCISKGTKGSHSEPVLGNKPAST